MKTLLVILGVSLLLVSGGINALLVREKSELTAKLADAETRVGQIGGELQSLKVKQKKLIEEAATFTDKLNAAKAAAAVAPAAPAKASSRGSVTPLANKSDAGIGRPESTKPMKALAEMMKNPAMREMAKQQQIAMMDMQYGDLYSTFALNDEEKADFKQLLAERLGIDSDMGMKLMDDTLTPDQRKAVLTEVNQQKKENNDRIRTFLNNDQDFQTFDHWENTKGERMQLAMGKAAFASEPLSPQQEQQLVDAMHEATMRPSSTPNLQRPENFDPRKFTQADLEKQLRKADDDAKAVRDAAARFMTPKQLEALTQAQASWRAMQEASLRMMNSMTGNGGK